MPKINPYIKQGKINPICEQKPMEIPQLSENQFNLSNQYCKRFELFDFIIWFIEDFKWDWFDGLYKNSQM